MIDISNLIKIVQEQFENSEELNLTAETDFKKLESFDSLTGMCIIVAIKDEFNIEISEKDFRKLTTVQSLYDLTSKQ